jgi:hypothetical protein
MFGFIFLNPWGTTLRPVGGATYDEPSKVEAIKGASSSRTQPQVWVGESGLRSQSQNHFANAWKLNFHKLRAWTSIATERPTSCRISLVAFHTDAFVSLKRGLCSSC